MSDQASGLLSAYLRRIRIRKAFPFLKCPILDVGCGIGHLAKHFNHADYTGTDIDQHSLQTARQNFPNHPFIQIEDLPATAKFSTIAILAVIEHIDHPSSLLSLLTKMLTPDGQIVLTTPHPAARKLHDLGACIGFFSRSAAEEHHHFFDRKAMQALAQPCNLRITNYQRFLWGANQIFILEKK